MKLRPFILPLFLVLTLAAVYFLPTAGDVAQSAVIMDLPEKENPSGWYFKAIPPSEAEIGTLAKDTEFSKAECYRIRPGEFDANGNPLPDLLYVSVVLSGADINNSIHRPERCMPAQGHQILESTNRTLGVKGGHSVTAKRLKSIQRLPKETEGEFLELKCLTYYFFVGHDTITNDHLGRTFTDMKDRLLKGMDQRWAYVSVSMWYGDMPWLEANVSEEEAEEKLADFVAKFSATQIKWDQVQP